MSAEKISQFPSVAAAEEFRLTDVGNAGRFRRDHGHMVRYVGALGGYIVWDGARWDLDEDGECYRLARDTIRSLYSEAAAELDPKRRAELAAHAKASDQRRSIENMLALGQSELGIAARPGIFDRDPWLLNTASGIVKLALEDAGACVPHDPNKYITKLAPTFYRPDARCPRWLTFLDKVMLGRLELIECLQRAVGYSLTGVTIEQVVFILIGSGANGKTTFLEVIRSILGNYATQTPADTLLVRPGGGGIPNDKARLHGKRFVSASEPEGGRRLAEGDIKLMTGGDTITARFLHREFFEFQPEFKLWLATNVKPLVRGTDHALWRRLRLIPFEYTVPPAERNKALVHSLLAESAGILAWAVEGCLAWQRQGLAEPEAVLSATAAYREEMDPVAQFIGDCCVIVVGIKGYGLYPAYQKWSTENGREALNALNFSLRLRDRGFPNERDWRGRYFIGIGLASDASEVGQP